MKKAALVLASVLGLACSDTPASIDTDGPWLSPELARAGNGVVQHVSVGSNDLCPALGQPPGCDANLSLVANKWADGTVRGQWHDEFGRDADGAQLGGVHVSIDCLEIVTISIGTFTFDVAWVSGPITRSSSPGFVVGEIAVTGVVDRGTSANDTFEDLASFMFPADDVAPGTTCADMPDLPVFLGVPFTGQVKIWSR